LLFSVIPARPVNVSVTDITTNSAIVHWRVPFPMTSFPPGLNHKILIQNQWESTNEWKVGLRNIFYYYELDILLILKSIVYHNSNTIVILIKLCPQVINITTNVHQMERTYHLADLKYANTAYDIRIHLKSAVASDINWGEFASVTFRTLSTCK
jgi:hypothetical protein